MAFLGLSRTQKKALEQEVISTAARLQLTRLLRATGRTRENEVTLANYNRYINMARTIQGLPIYVLEPDDWGGYESPIYAWHLGELELVTRRGNTAQLVELLADYVECGILDEGEVSAILKGDGVGVEIELGRFDEQANVSIRDISDLEEDESDDHPNIRLLIQRMETANENRDYAAVLHASASVFETLAKVIFDSATVENSTLGSIIAGYRNRSGLPDELLDFIEDTYTRRNQEPLAGHGATKAPTVTAAEAAILVEVTKMCVRLERRLAGVQLSGSDIKSATQSPAG